MPVMGELMLEVARDTEEIIERVAALDIGKAKLVCCVRVPDESSTPRQEGPPSSRSARACRPCTNLSEAAGPHMRRAAASRAAPAAEYRWGAVAAFLRWRTELAALGRPHQVPRPRPAAAAESRFSRRATGTPAASATMGPLSRSYREIDSRLLSLTVTALTVAPVRKRRFDRTTQ